MTSTRVRLALFTGLVAALLNNSFAREFFIRDGDRVVFLGDSITE